MTIATRTYLNHRAQNPGIVNATRTGGLHSLQQICETVSLRQECSLFLTIWTSITNENTWEEVVVAKLAKLTKGISKLLAELARLTNNNKQPQGWLSKHLPPGLAQLASQTLTTESPAKYPPNTQA